MSLQAYDALSSNDLVKATHLAEVDIYSSTRVLQTLRDNPNHYFSESMGWYVNIPEEEMDRAEALSTEFEKKWNTMRTTDGRTVYDMTPP